MKLTAVERRDLSTSVIAVPPLARTADLSLDKGANAALVGYLESGGVRSLLYGGNANFYHLPVSEYAATVDMLAEIAGPDTWVLPSIGPDYGKALDQAAVLRERLFPTAMLLPMSFPYTEPGLADGIRRLTDALGMPAVIYIKSDGYLLPETLAALVEEGRVASIKYAVVRADFSADSYLERIVEAVDPALVVSGIGERPAAVHMRKFGLASFTAGSVCIAPRGSMALLDAIQAGDETGMAEIWERYRPLEDLRDLISPIRVLHDAVTLSGVADMGPMLPMLGGLDEAERARVAPVALALRDGDAAFEKRVAA